VVAVALVQLHMVVLARWKSQLLVGLLVGTHLAEQLRTLVAQVVPGRLRVITPQVVVLSLLALQELLW
jgi:hypothetical protein